MYTTTPGTFLGIHSVTSSVLMILRRAFHRIVCLVSCLYSCRMRQSSIVTNILFFQKLNFCCCTLQLMVSGCLKSLQLRHSFIELANSAHNLGVV